MQHLHDLDPEAIFTGPVEPAHEATGGPARRKPNGTEDQGRKDEND